MRMFSRAWTIGAAVAIIGLGGCASTKLAGPAPRAAAAPAVPASDDGDSGLRDAIGRLYNGDPDGASKLLKAVLKRHPGDPTATSLMRQIDTDPQTLLGRDSFAYRSQANDTLSQLAERYLGDPLLFYALARYNNLSAAGELPPGLVLRIPGRERPQSRAARSAPEPRPASSVAKLTAPHPAPTPAAPNDPHRASLIRAAALEQMDRGAIDRAVALFEEAARLDPGNALIQHDLDRALRISRAVHAKS